MKIGNILTPNQVRSLVVSSWNNLQPVTVTPKVAVSPAQAIKALQGVFIGATEANLRKTLTGIASRLFRFGSEAKDKLGLIQNEVVRVARAAGYKVELLSKDGKLSGFKFTRKEVKIEVKKASGTVKAALKVHLRTGVLAVFEAGVASFMEKFGNKLTPVEVKNTEAKKQKTENVWDKYGKTLKKGTKEALIKAKGLVKDALKLDKNGIQAL